jgi:hypothetical protein
MRKEGFIHMMGYLWVGNLNQFFIPTTKFPMDGWMGGCIGFRVYNRLSMQNM